jgi:endonuclease YncB( thermonuclease family)
MNKASGPSARRFKTAWPLWLLFIIIVAGFLHSLLKPVNPGLRESAAALQAAPQPASAMEAVRTVLDGDSIICASGKAIRLLGIDAPEKGQPYAREAGDFLASLVNGRPLTLVFGNVRQDKYKRTLAHIVLEADGRSVLVSEALLRRGLARMYIIPPDFLFLDRLRAAQAEALDQGRGIWQVPIKPAPHYVVSAWKFHRPDCPHVKAITRPKRSSNRTDILRGGKSPCRTCRP